MSNLEHPMSGLAAGMRTAAVADIFRSLVRALVNRRQVRRLGDLSDRGLVDIGLVRGDLYYARRTPLGVDPTARLARMARERAHPRRA